MPCLTVNINPEKCTPSFELFVYELSFAKASEHKERGQYMYALCTLFDIFS